MSRGRHKKIRYVQKMPQIVQFSPRGKAGRPDEMELRVDEFEAIKLTDFQGYNQSEGARAMGISRPTFGRILRSGRKVLSNALVNGKIIRIRIGNVQVGVKQKNLPSKEELGEGRIEEQSIRQKILKYPRKEAAPAPKTHLKTI